MKKKHKKQDEYIINPFMKHIDEELIKINQKLAEIKAEQKQLVRLYNRIDTWITRIYEHLDVLEMRTKYLVEKDLKKKENSIIKKIKKWLSTFLVS